MDVSVLVTERYHECFSKERVYTSTRSSRMDPLSDKLYVPSSSESYYFSFLCIQIYASVLHHNDDGGYRFPLYDHTDQDSILSDAMDRFVGLYFHRFPISKNLSRRSGYPFTALFFNETTMSEFFEIFRMAIMIVAAMRHSVAVVWIKQDKNSFFFSRYVSNSRACYSERYD